MKSYLKLFLTFIISWGVILLISFALNLFSTPVQYAASPLIIAILVTLMIFARPNKKSTQKHRTPSKTTKMYVCKHLDNTILYEIHNNKVFAHLTNKILYEIKGNKVYKMLDSKPSFVIKGQKIYYPHQTTPVYRIDNNKIYEGNFGKVPIFRLKNST